MIFLLSFLLLPSLLFSMGNSSGQSGENIAIQKSGGSTAESTADKNIVPLTKSIKKTFFYNEVFLSHLERHEKNMLLEKRAVVDIVDGKNSKDFAYNLVEEREKALKVFEDMLKEKETNASTEEDEALKALYRYGSGYCYLDNDIEITRIATYAYLNCDLNAPFDNVTLAVSFVPEFYAKAVIGSLLYVSKDGKRYPVANGVLLTKDRNSINVANYVNDNMTKKILATSGYKGLNSVALQAQAYMTQKTASDTSQETITTNNGLTSTTTTTTNTSDPDLGTYLVSATIQLASEISTIIGEAYINSLPYVFKVNKGSVFFVDMQFEEKDEMRGYSIPQTSIVKQEPSFVDGVEKTIVNDAVNIINSQLPVTTTNTKE